MCEPVTVKLPALPLTVPVLVLPSPQLMLALKSLARAPTAPPVKVPTVTLPVDLPSWPVRVLDVTVMESRALMMLTYSVLT